MDLKFQNSGSNDERGSVTTEFVMILPVLVAAMLFLMGLGYSLMTKQNAIVGARAAVYYSATLEEAPQIDMNEMVKNSVSPGREQWSLIRYEGGRRIDPGLGGPGVVDDPDLNAGGVIQGPVNRLYQMFNNEISYTASGTATLGFLPRIMNLGRARASYALPHRTWTCKQSGGSYARVAMNALGLPDLIKRILDSSCCESYESTR